VVIHHPRAIPTLRQMPAPMMPTVEINRVARLQRVHECTQIRARRLHHQVKMSEARMRTGDKTATQQMHKFGHGAHRADGDHREISIRDQTTNPSGWF